MNNTISNNNQKRSLNNDLGTINTTATKKAKHSHIQEDQNHVPSITRSILKDQYAEKKENPLPSIQNFTRSLVLNDNLSKTFNTSQNVFNVSSINNSHQPPLIPDHLGQTQLPIPPMPTIDYEKLFQKLSDQTSQGLTKPYDSANCRFTNILFPIETLVKVPGETEKTYLPANHVRLEGVDVIVTQYPLSCHFKLFWRACAEVSLILDLTNSKDMKKDLLPYAPAKSIGILQTIGIEPIIVTYKEQQPIEGIEAQLYTYHVEDTHSMAPFDIKRLHYEGWRDDSGISEDNLDTLLTFLEPYQKDPKRPMIIHGQAGVGRSGTVTVANALYHLIKKKQVNADNLITYISELILEGRKQRGIHFVQNVGQLKAIVRWGWRRIHRRYIPNYLFCPQWGF